MTTSDNATSDSKWEQVKKSGFKFQKETKTQSDSWRLLSFSKGNKNNLIPEGFYLFWHERVTEKKYVQMAINLQEKAQTPGNEVVRDSRTFLNLYCS